MRFLTFWQQWIDLHCLTPWPGFKQLKERLFALKTETILSCENDLKQVQAYRGCFTILQITQAPPEGSAVLPVKEVMGLPVAETLSGSGQCTKWSTCRRSCIVGLCFISFICVRTISKESVLYLAQARTRSGWYVTHLHPPVNC